METIGSCWVGNLSGVFKGTYKGFYKGTTEYIEA